MLVLTRKQHQSLFLGDSIRITVLDVRGGQVRLGIEAPRTLSVVREEVLDDLALSNQEACASAAQPASACLESLAEAINQRA